MSARRDRSKTLLFSALALLLASGVVELAATIGYAIVRDDVDLVVGWSEALDEEKYRHFLAHGYDPIVGWLTPRGGEMAEENCLGEHLTQHYDPRGARIHAAAVAGPVRVVVVGDSFTQGAEATDEDTYPAQLERLLGVRVANHGMGGYGPYQALLSLEQEIVGYPDADTVVLGIMHENVMRMATSLRGVITPGMGMPYAFKPFVRDGAFHPNPNAEPAATLAELESRGRHAFETDFFSRGRWSFPFTASWARYLGTRAFRFELRSRYYEITRDSAKGYEAYYESEAVRDDLLLVLERFHRFASDRGLSHVVAFIPRKRGDQRSADPVIEEARSRFGDAFPIVAVGQTLDPPVDWNAYNLKPGKCHPSAYGYGVIAREVARRILR